MVLHLIVSTLVYVYPGSDPQKLRIFQNVKYQQI